MRMYTQAKGILNVDSVNSLFNNDELYEILQQAKYDFYNDNNIQIDRKWVCDNTGIVEGGNGSSFIYFCAEMKNYGDPIRAWIKYLLNYFPNAEGQMLIQYECQVCPNVITIFQGKIVSDVESDFKQIGYGNTHVRRKENDQNC